MSTLTDETRDDELVDLVKQGDLDAFETLMGLHVNRLRSFIAMKAPVAQLIDEIAHESFVFAYQRIHEFQQGDFGAWLRAIAFNLLRAEFKRLSRQKENTRKYAEAVMIETCTATEMPTSPTIKHLAACLERLGAITRKLIEGRYREQRPVEAMAQELGQSSVAVRVALFRGRRQLRDCIVKRLQAEGT